MLDDFSGRGFLTKKDPTTQFVRYPELASLTAWGRKLPDILEDARSAREYLRTLDIPEWPINSPTEHDIPELRLYYVYLGFIASGYINQVGAPECFTLPSNIAVPLVSACRLLNRPPVLSYDGYALYNWYRIDPSGPIILGNIDTIQNFVNLYDEHWFILVHIEIEALAAQAISAISGVIEYFSNPNRLECDANDVVNYALDEICHSMEAQISVLRRIPEKMSPDLYFSDFRPYIRFFENVVYEGVSVDVLNYRGETGAQSSIMPALVAFMKIPHTRNELINHLSDMRKYMPKSHRQWIAQVEQLPDQKAWVEPQRFNAVLDTMARFREVHYQWAEDYISSKVTDPRGTGGTPYIKWLKQLIDETLSYKMK